MLAGGDADFGFYNLEQRRRRSAAGPRCERAIVYTAESWENTGQYLWR